MKPTTKLLHSSGTAGQAGATDTTHSELSSALSIDSRALTNWPNSRRMEELKMQRCRTNTCHALWILLGLFLLLGSVQILWAPTYLENIVHDGITEAFIFTKPMPDDENYDSWVTNDRGKDSVPIKVYMQFWNLTNPNDVVNGSLPMSLRIPQFELSAPIVYTQYYYRENISFSADGTMSRSYFKTRFFHDAELSEISEDAVFTIIAPLVAGGVHWSERNPADAQGALGRFLSDGFFQWLDADGGDKLFSTATATDLIFNILKFRWPETDLTFGGQTVPAGAVIDFQYGLLKNGSGSWYISHTGYGDETRMGEVLKWSNQPQNFEPSAEDPVLLNFEDGNFTFIDCWYPHMPYSPSHFIYQGVWAIKERPEEGIPPFFVSTLRKPLYFDYHGAVDFKGIPAEQYNTSTGRQFWNESVYPPNAQFYQFGPSGVLNMTKCFNDLPLFFSLPKFYGAPDFAANNSLMNMPSPSGLEDNGYLRVEPMTGAALDANVALQGNVPINPIPIDITNQTMSLSHLPPGLMAPTYLLRYKASLPDAGAEELSARIGLANNLDTGFHIAAYVCWALGALFWTFTAHWLGRNGVKRIFPGFCCATHTELQSQIKDARA